MRKISSRNSLLTHFRPARVLHFERHVQYSLKPDRCQRTTVSGWTMTSVRFHPDQNRRSITQKTLSGAVSLGWEFRAFKTLSCCRKARISSSKSRREHKLQAIRPMNNLNIRSIHGLYQARCLLTSDQILFWRATGLEHWLSYRSRRGLALGGLRRAPISSVRTDSSDGQFRPNVPQLSDPHLADH
jgi:hypothetical protein